MNVNPLIEEIFKNFEVDGEQIPVNFLFYTGKSDSYLTYYTWQNTAKDFWDGMHHAETASVTIDVFSRKNFKNLVEAVKQKMIEGGFTWTDNAAETYEQDTKYFHVPMNFQIGSPFQIQIQTQTQTQT
jgi:hypothetical protein